MKNAILKATAATMAFLFGVSVVLINAPTWIPFIACMASLSWLLAFYFINIEYFIGGDSDEDGA